jgi:hypothetical protein
VDLQHGNPLSPPGTLEDVTFSGAGVFRARLAAATIAR